MVELDDILTFLHSIIAGGIGGRGLPGEAGGEEGDGGSKLDNVIDGGCLLWRGRRCVPVRLF